MNGPHQLALRFGENLLIQRRRADLSQEQLGRLASLHRTEIGLLERGMRLPRLDTIVKIAGSIEIEAADLLEGMGWRSGATSDGSFDLPSRMELAAARAAAKRPGGGGPQP